jgi:hypothetical protein
MTNLTPIEVVQQWQDAANQQNVPILLELSDRAIELVGPRGVAQGHQVLADWVQRAGAQFTTLRVFAHAERVVVVQHGEWHSPETREVIGQAEVATSFYLDQHRVKRVARFDSLEQALQDAQLTMDNEHKVL